MARILVADDETITLRALERVLKKEGHEVIVVEDGERALQVLGEEDVDILITDIKLPGMDGIALLEWVKQHKPGVRVIMITGYSSIKGAVEAMKRGASDYIAKPFSLEEIAASVRAVLEEESHRISLPPGGFSREEFELLIRALNHPLRREILRLLNVPRNFTEIWRTIGTRDPTAVSFHLRNLKAMGLVKQDRSKAYSLSELGEKALSLLNMVKVEERVI
ncbi:MAG: response regulator [Euryarchaeota archaeon]|nr:response regulator [Euryarchaeota archaeon]